MRKKNKKISIILPLFLSSVFFLAIFTLNVKADVILENPLSFGGARDISSLIKTVINGILGVIGAVSLLMFIYGGANLLLSASREKWITRGWDTLTWSSIGLITVFMSYAVLNFVLQGIATKEEAAPTYTAPTCAINYQPPQGGKKCEGCWRPTIAVENSIGQPSYNNNSPVTPQFRVCQSFTTSSNAINITKAQLRIYSLNEKKWTAEIRGMGADGERPETAAKASKSVSVSNREGDWVEFVFDQGVKVSRSTQYFLCLYNANSDKDSAVSYYRPDVYGYGNKNTRDAYGGGNLWSSSNGGASWDSYPLWDMAFRIFINEESSLSTYYTNHVNTFDREARMGEVGADGWRREDKVCPSGMECWRCTRAMGERGGCARDWVGTDCR